METTFLDEEIVEINKTVSCPTCRTKYKISLNDSEFCCEICGETIEIELAEMPLDDFIWHPSELF